ncbi:hypothetical protein ACFVHQ_01960 [Actinomycetes bacterium NPDC127524]
MVNRKMEISLKELLKFLKVIDDTPFNMFSTLQEEGFLKIPKKANSNNDVHSSGFFAIFLEAMEFKQMDFQYEIAYNLGMPKYDIDNTSIYDYIDMIFLTYYNDEITEDELIEGIEINAKDPNFKENPKFIKAIGGWGNLNLPQ